MRWIVLRCVGRCFLSNETTIGAQVRTFGASDGYCLCYRHYAPVGSAWVRVVCLHGIQSHSGWYDYSSRRLAAAGCDVYYLDRRGSGLNFAARGDAPGMRRLLLDVAEFIGARQAEVKLPVVVCACSWGGKLGAALCRFRPGIADGLVLICPGFFPRVRPSLVQRLAIVAASLLAPGRRFTIPLTDPALFTAVPRWQEYIARDPLALHRATARFLRTSFLLDRDVRRVPRYVTVPTLLLLAGQDRIVHNDRTAQFVRSFASADTTIHVLPHAHHTLEFEPDPEVFIAVLLDWLRKRWASPVG
ncbi:MAG: lysophospholipase [Gemmataceae bacterium]